MNWLGHLIQKEISKNDTVLDLGCGIMQCTTDTIEFYPSRNPFKNTRILNCKSLLGCDIWIKYLEKVKNIFPVIQISMNELYRFVDESFDVVICLDVLEHLSLPDASHAINEMKRIARKKVIIYTPSAFETNDEHVENVWEIGFNQHQLHKCFVSPQLLQEAKFKISFPEPDHNTLAIYTKGEKKNG